MNKSKKRKAIKIKNNEYKEHKEYKKAERKKGSFLKNVAIFLSAFCVLYLFFILTFGDNTSQNKTTFYLLLQGSYENSAEAYSEADNIKILGGGGNIWEEGSKYNVVAFTYNDVDSASEVQNRLKDESLSLIIKTMSIKTSSLEPEESLFINSIIDVSDRVYQIMLSIPEGTSQTQTLAMLEEVEKSMITATVRGELLAESDTISQNISITGAQISSAFSSVASSQTISTQNLSWLRTQILIYAYEYTQNY